MGGFLSSLKPPVSSDDQSEPSLVMGIHSSSDWEAHFDTVKSTNQLMVVDFSASWCGPCRFIEPTFKEFARKYTDVFFAKIDVDEVKDVARQLGVQAMPTFLLFKGGKQIDKVVGAKRDELERKIQTHK